MVADVKIENRVAHSSLININLILKSQNIIINKLAPFGSIFTIKCIPDAIFTLIWLYLVIAGKSNSIW